MMHPTQTPARRGQLYMADFGSEVGSEQSGVRPIVILQNNTANRFCPTLTVAPLTTKLKKIRQLSHVLVLRGNGLESDSMVLLEQIRSIDRTRLIQPLGQLTAVDMNRVDLALAGHLSLAPAADPDENRQLLTLCTVCSKSLMVGRKYLLRRFDVTQREKALCSHCRLRKGFDYWVSPLMRKKRLY